MKRMNVSLRAAVIACMAYTAPAYADDGAFEWLDTTALKCDVQWLDVLSLIEARSVDRNWSAASFPFISASADGSEQRYLAVGGFTLGSFTGSDQAELAVLTRSYVIDELPEMRCDISVLRPSVASGQIRWDQLVFHAVDVPIACGTIVGVTPREARSDALNIEGCAKVGEKQGKLSVSITLEVSPYEQIGLAAFSEDSGCSGLSGNVIDLIAPKNREVTQAVWRLGAVERQRIEQDAKAVARVTHESPTTRAVWQRSEQQRVLIVQASELVRVQQLLQDQGLKFEASPTVTLCEEPGGAQVHCEVYRIEVRY